MNPLLCCDVYKMAHLEQYPDDIAFIYSYLHTRRADKYPRMMMFGLQYYLQQYFQPFINQTDIDEFIFMKGDICGFDNPIHLKNARDKLQALLALGYWPLKIKALPEGLVVNNPNCLMTIENTVPGFHWVVGLFESLLLKIWNTCTVATYSYELKQMLLKYNGETADNEDCIPFQIHDFGYRGCSSEETARLSGAAHLINFLGSDTVPAVDLAFKHYEAKNPIGVSIPATEHSVMTCYGRDEIAAFNKLLDLYPKGPLSVVCDTYDLYHCILSVCCDKELHARIMERPGKLIFRPDSGNPEHVLLGNPNGETTQEKLGVYRLLDIHFGGSTINTKGYKVLNSNIGVIYGDAMYKDRIERILEGLKGMQFSSDNFYAGVGGLLLQQHNRDDMAFSMKASQVMTYNGSPRPLIKDPKTDPSKKSQGGRFKVIKVDGFYTTVNNAIPEDIYPDWLITMYEDGWIKNTTFSDIRKRAAGTL